MCVHRTAEGICKKFSVNGVLSYCVDGPCPDEVLTNADRIRIMSDEELAEQNVRKKYECDGWECFSVFITSDGEQFGDVEEAYKHELEWLKQPAKEG